MKLLEKWREFLEGGNDIWVFLKKGKLPHRAEQGPEPEQEPGRTEQSRAGPSRAEQEKQTECLKEGRV